MERWLGNHGKDELKFVKSKDYDRIVISRVNSKHVNSAEVGDFYTCDTGYPTSDVSEGFTLTPHGVSNPNCLAKENEKGCEGKRRVR